MGVVNNIYVVEGISRTTAKLMKTGQTTSYRTGDDGDIEAGRDVDFFTLAENNPFGNTNRFTDELGGQTYANNIVIDWSTYDGSTVLGWCRLVNGGIDNNDKTWNNSIDGALSLNIGGYTGWYLPNIMQIFSILNLFTTGHRLGYAPFLLTSTYIWASTPNPQNIDQAFRIDNPTILLSPVGISGKGASNSFRFIACRDFTVTGTTLT